MALTGLFRELAIEQAPKQAVMVDAVTEEAPILAMLPMQAASNGFQNVYEDLKEVTGAQFVALDEALPTVGADGEIKYVDLSVLGGIQEVGEDKAQKFGGAANYFAGKMGSILRVTGADTEQSILYNNIRTYAKANSKLQEGGGTNSGAMYSMLCVKWVEGETTGLYDTTGFGDGKVFDLMPVSGGNAYKDANNVLVYGQRMKTYIGIQLANDRNVSGIANIDLVADGDEDSGFVALPTEAQIDQMLLDARANPANTFIYMHPRLKNALNVYKGSRLELGVLDRDLDRTFDQWNGINIITSYNFLETEATEAGL
jgi:hypothetical protein